MIHILQKIITDIKPDISSLQEPYTLSIFFSKISAKVLRSSKYSLLTSARKCSSLRAWHFALLTEAVYLVDIFFKNIRQGLAELQVFTLHSMSLIKNEKPLSTLHSSPSNRGFTLIETLVAISILLVSISAPLTIASRSLAASFFARDQITAFYLAQDAVEYIRNARDNNFLSNVNWLLGFPDTTGLAFTVDTTDGTMALCGGGACPFLEYNDTTGFYNYGDAGASDSIFIRSVSITTINVHEVIIAVTISWSTGTFMRTFSVKENILDWK